MDGTQNRNSSWQNFKVVYELQKSEIQILEKLMEVLPSNDNVVIDEWLNRLERFTLHRFNEEEAEMRRLGYPHLDENQKDHSMALSKLRVTRRMWDNDQNTVHLWHYLDKDYFNWFTQHLNNFDIPADNFSRRNHKPKTLAQPKSNSSLDIS